MQSLLAKQGKTLVKAGALQGTAYEDVPKERILKAAKRYTGDPDFSRFARSYALLSELEDDSLPAPCMPLVPVSQKSDAKESLRKRLFSKTIAFLFGTWQVKLLLLCFCLALILRPAFSKMLSKLVVSTFRIGARRLLTFFVSILEGMLDELIYQVDFMMRDALPNGMNLNDAAKAPVQFFSHLISSMFGAAVAVLIQYRRAPLH
eukprot:Skav233442  [mRNA]  locus=scaffold1486:337681:338295:- [translate_table: standard]